MTGFKYAIAAFLLFVSGFTYAQSSYDNILFRDHIYEDYIRTVMFNIQGLENSLPVFELGASDVLELRFDDMDAVAKYYKYTVIHCNRNWVPSELWRNEYVDGFEDEDITEFSFSVGTRQNYAHYRLSFPNRNFKITKSGNYLLVIFDSENPEYPVITRRFMVVEPIVLFDARRVRPADVAKMNTHHEIRFDLDIKDLFPKPRNPKVDLTCSVIQNRRWDNALQGIVSRREQGNIYSFDGVDVITFPAGKQFRPMDIRSTQHRSLSIFEFQHLETHTVAVAKIDEPRAFQPFFDRIDIDGNFVINTLDYGPEVMHDVRCEYIETVFTLKVDYPYTQDVYVFGGLTDWELKPEFRLAWDDTHKAYQGSAWLKQGFYDYIYVLANSDGSGDEETIEGNWFESSNYYTIFVYYREFGARYDRIVGARTL